LKFIFVLTTLVHLSAWMKIYMQRIVTEFMEFTFALRKTQSKERLSCLLLHLQNLIRLVI
jgi:hypothetical protein